LGTATSSYIADSNWGTLHRNFQYGAVYCLEGQATSWAVYGPIYTKWTSQNGNYGYPISDVNSITDSTGKVPIQYSTFSDGTNQKAIYWTSQHGACLIYGNIYGKWLSIGDVKSSVGYPITDETGSGNAGGRYNDFSNGFIYWHAGTSWVKPGAIPDFIQYSTGPINFPNEKTGTLDITFEINGGVRLQGSFVEESYGDYPQWEVGAMMVNADGTAISLYKGSGVNPSAFTFDVVTSSTLIGSNWRAWLSATYWKWLADPVDDEPGMLFGLLRDVQQGYPSITGATAILS
jgi:hypothetical protein